MHRAKGRERYISPVGSNSIRAAALLIAGLAATNQAGAADRDAILVAQGQARVNVDVIHGDHSTGADPMPQAVAAEEPSVPAQPPTAKQLERGVPLHCDDPNGFYPHVGACKGAWNELGASAPQAAAPPAATANNGDAASHAQAPDAATPAAGASEPADTGDDALARAKAAGFNSMSDYLAALAAANLDTVRRHDREAQERKDAAKTKRQPSDTPPPAQAVSAPLPPPAPQPLPAAVQPPAAPPPAIAAAPPHPAAPEPAQAVAAPPHVAMAATGNGKPDSLEQLGVRYAIDTGVNWSLSQATDNATKSTTLVARSKQLSADGSALAIVDAACVTGEKIFSLKARLVDESGSAVPPLTERMQLGDGNFESTYFHTENTYNQLVLTSKFGGEPIANSPAKALLTVAKALYEIKTSLGTVLIKIASYDPNLRKVLEACQN